MVPSFNFNACTQSVCLNHPDTPAVTRCAACGKPICEQCIVESNGSRFCSEQCAENAAKSYDRVTTMAAGKARAEKRSSMRAVIIVIILAAIAAAAYYYYTNNKKDVDRLVRKAEQKVNQKIQKAGKDAKDVKDDIKDNVPGSSKYKRDREKMVQ